MGEVLSMKQGEVAGEIERLERLICRITWAVELGEGAWAYEGVSDADVVEVESYLDRHMPNRYK